MVDDTSSMVVCTFSLVVSARATAMMSWNRQPTDSIDRRSSTSDPTAKSASKLPAPIVEAMAYKALIHSSNE